MNKKLVEVGTAVIALFLLVIIFLMGASVTKPETASLLYLAGILMFTGTLIILGRRVSSPVV
jgi:uncharacterized membrane protein YgdD (TMEM256/DUF423 family)